MVQKLAVLGLMSLLVGCTLAKWTLVNCFPALPASDEMVDEGVISTVKGCWTACSAYEYAIYDNVSLDIELGAHALNEILILDHGHQPTQTCYCVSPNFSSIIVAMDH